MAFHARACAATTANGCHSRLAISIELLEGARSTAFVYHRAHARDKRTGITAVLPRSAINALKGSLFEIKTARRVHQIPVTGRYISKDPLGYPNGLNNYLYCGNNPINRIDPLGLEDKKPDEKKPKDEVRHYDVAVFLKNNKSQAAWGSSDPKSAKGREDNSRGISLINGDYTPKQVAEKIRAACGEFKREAEKDGVKFDITVAMSGHGAAQYVETGSGQYISPESAKEFAILKDLGIKQISIGACTRNVSQMDKDMLDVKNQEQRDDLRKTTYDEVAKAAGTKVVGTLGPDVDARGAKIDRENARKYTTTGDRDTAIDPIKDTGWVIPPQRPEK